MVYIDPNEYNAEALRVLTEIDDLNVATLLDKYDWRRSAQALWNIV